MYSQGLVADTAASGAKDSLLSHVTTVSSRVGLFENIGIAADHRS
jgi:hypothetical protein